MGRARHLLQPPVAILREKGFPLSTRARARAWRYRRLRNLCNVKANHRRAVTFTNQNPWNGLYVAKIPQSPVTSPIPRVLTGGRDPPLCFTCCKDLLYYYPRYILRKGESDRFCRRRRCCRLVSYPDRFCRLHFIYGEKGSGILITYARILPPTQPQICK